MFEKLEEKERKLKVRVSVQQLRTIIKSENFINVFSLDSEEGCQDIELAILRACLNSWYKKHFLF